MFKTDLIGNYSFDGGNMEKLDLTQKKKILQSVLYALIVALLVVAASITVIALSQNGEIENSPNLSIGDNQEIVVSAPSYVVPMRDATIIKDYSAKELQYNESLKQWEIHKAIDFQAGENLEVLAFSDGTVSRVYSNYLEGTVIEISHDNGLVSVYKSLESASVKQGDKVSAGQKIGVIGTTMAQEQNQGKHLHFELHQNGKKINPNDYLDLGSK